MPRAKMRKDGKRHEQHRLCCVTHSLREHRLQGSVAWSTSAGASELSDTGWFNQSLGVTTLVRAGELQRWVAGEGRHRGRCRCCQAPL